MTQNLNVNEWLMQNLKFNSDTKTDTRTEFRFIDGHVTVCGDSNENFSSTCDKWRKGNLI